MPLQLPDPQLPGNPEDALQSIQRNFEALATSVTAPSESATVSYVNSFADYGSPYAVVSYYIDPFRRVHLRGAMKRTSGSANGVTAFTLPTGFRPSATENFTTPNSTTDDGKQAIIEIGSGGAVSVRGDETTFISLSGISFRAA